MSNDGDKPKPKSSENLDKNELVLEDLDGKLGLDHLKLDDGWLIAGESAGGSSGSGSGGDSGSGGGGSGGDGGPGGSGGK